MIQITRPALVDHQTYFLVIFTLGLPISKEEFFSNQANSVKLDNLTENILQKIHKIPRQTLERLITRQSTL